MNNNKITKKKYDEEWREKLIHHAQAKADAEDSLLFTFLVSCVCLLGLWAISHFNWETYWLIFCGILLLLSFPTFIWKSINFIFHHFSEKNAREALNKSKNINC
ncbi:MAG: hypothetical protein WCT18_02220 [Patescibacteria group bacterium]